MTSAANFATTEPKMELATSDNRMDLANPALRDEEKPAPPHCDERQLKARQVNKQTSEAEQPAPTFDNESPASALARMDRSCDKLAAPPLGVEQPTHAHGAPADTIAFSICTHERSLT